MAHDESLPPEYGANKTAELMAKTLRWKLEKCFCETVSKSSKGILLLFLETMYYIIKSHFIPNYVRICERIPSTLDT